jgi:2-polyprenyl-3-methyl-5-hydroxy-6-metoxy-1,4-benzoquinol methylase
LSFLALDRQKYEDLAAVPAYADHSPGEQYAPMFLELVGEQRGSVLDAGCCTGKGGLALAKAGFDVTLCDYTDALLIPEAARLGFLGVRTLWTSYGLRQFGFVYCCDVLEHIPREFTMLTASNLVRKARHGAFFSIALTPDSFGAWVGKPLHETVESFVWWRDRLKEFGTLEDARDLGHTGIYYVRPH